MNDEFEEVKEELRQRMKREGKFSGRVVLNALAPEGAFQLSEEAKANPNHAKEKAIKVKSATDHKALTKFTGQFRASKGDGSKEAFDDWVTSLNEDEIAASVLEFYKTHYVSAEADLKQK